MPFPLETILSASGWRERFEVQDRIAQGGMGQVWRALDRESGREVALKIIISNREGDEGTLARLEAEGETLIRLRQAGGHDFVVPIHDFRVTEDHACLVMEFIPGQNLRKWCSTHRLSLHDRVSLIAQVARAAGWFHGLGVIHRDLKPANILVSAITRQPVIVDFSIAKVEDTLTLTLTNEALGTAPYMAPEQFDRRRAPVSPATDVYALGATLYELLTEVPPHPGDFAVIVQRHTDEARPARPTALNAAIPRDLESVILKALAHRPADRYTDGTALAEDLERFLAGQPVRARPVSRLIYVARLVRKKPAFSAALAACLTLGLLAAWSAHHRAAERDVHLMESAVITAMQGREWSRHDLLQQEATLLRLQARAPQRAVSLRQRLHVDVADDLGFALQKNHLSQEDFAWMEDTLDWLTEIKGETSTATLRQQLLQRQSRWELLDELSAPITDTGSFFPGKEIHLRDGLLHLQADAGQTRSITAYTGLTLPLEVATEWSGQREHFASIGLSLIHSNIETQALLCRADRAPKAALALLNDKDTPPDPDHNLLALLQNQDILAVRNMKRMDFSSGICRLVLRIDPRHLEFQVNDIHSLTTESDIALGSTSSANVCRLLWPAAAGLRHITFKTRRQQQPGPLEAADLLLMQSRWLDASTLYETLLGDPAYAAEARYKLAHCRRRTADHAAANELWSQLAQGPPNKWRDRAAYQLWIWAAYDRGIQAANAYILSVSDKLPRQVLWEFGQSVAESVEFLYLREGYGISYPGISQVHVSTTDRALDILQKPDLQRINRLGMAMHLARLDEHVINLHQNALANMEAVTLNAESLRAVGNVFDQWSRITAAQSDDTLLPKLHRWQRSLPQDPTLNCLHQLELARRAARAQRDLPAALRHATAASADPATDDRRLVTAKLLEGMIHRLSDDETRAQECWQEALNISRIVRYRAPLHLWDCVILHSLTRTWDLDSATRVLGHLLTMHIAQDTQDKRNQALSRFQQTFLADASFLTALNSLTTASPDFGQLAEDYAFYQDTPRSLLQRFYRLLFTHWFQQSALPTPSTVEDQQRVQRAVDQLITQMTLQPDADSTDLHAFFKAWHDPATARQLLARTDFPHPPELVTDLKWLLSQRHP